jgi:N-acetylmuramoyl-L-alanine amidase
MRPITHISIHTAAHGKDGKVFDTTVAQIDQWHRARGWNGIGYNGLFRLDGTYEKGRPETVIPAAVEGFNTKTLAYCFSGHGDIADFTDAQKKAAYTFIARKLAEHGLAAVFVRNPMRVFGHREVNGFIDAGVVKAPKTTKTCPGTKVDMTEFRRGVMQQVLALGLDKGPEQQ